MTIAKSNTIKKGEKIIEDINEVVRHREDFASQVKVQDKLRDTITANLHK
jgi:serine/threonine-protein kinase HipA